MADNNTTIVSIDTSTDTLRFEYISIGGRTYKVGLSLEETKSFVDAVQTLNDNLIAVNEDVEALKTEIDNIKKNYMAYYDVDSEKGIEADNVYTDTFQTQSGTNA